MSDDLPEPNRLTEPMDAQAAFAIAEQHANDPDAIVFLIPTLDDLLGGEARDAAAAAKSLTGMRIMFDSLASGMEKAIVMDSRTGTRTTEHFRSTAVSIETTLIQAFGSHPDLLARLLTQHVIDTVLEGLADGDDYGTPSDLLVDEDGQAERERVRAAIAKSPVTTLNEEGVEMLTDDIMAALGEGD